MVSVKELPHAAKISPKLKNPQPIKTVDLKG